MSRAAFVLIVCLTAAGCADPTTTTAPTTAALSGIALSSDHGSRMSITNGAPVDVAIARAASCAA